MITRFERRGTSNGWLLLVAALVAGAAAAAVLVAGGPSGPRQASAERDATRGH
jgi:hypothetical protein